jgi:three-Cys-motif partner protein
MLRDYLHAFTVAASKKAPTTTYLDLFAGGPENLDRDTGEPVASSPQIALETSPPFTDLRFFELAAAAELEAALRAQYPDRAFAVTPGDSNTTVGEVLGAGDLSPRAPAFAFIDPNGPDCWWTTLETLAGFKRGVSEFKVELWMLFPEGMMTRLLPRTGELRPEVSDRITRVFGTDEWLLIYRARVEGRLEPDEARFEYVNLMRRRLEHELGYTWTHAFTVRNSKRPLYEMVFATDHPAGHQIMGDIYAKFAARFPEMAEEARRRRRRQEALFTPHTDSARYEHTPALPPYGSPSRRA